jgi:hypothetical protein
MKKLSGLRESSAIVTDTDEDFRKEERVFIERQLSRDIQ